MFLECNSYITWCSTWTKLQMQEYVNTMCNIMRSSAKRCRQVLFKFWFWRGRFIPPFKITGGLGACPQKNWRSAQLRSCQFIASVRTLANLATVENRQKSKIGELLILLFILASVSKLKRYKIISVRSGKLIDLSTNCFWVFRIFLAWLVRRVLRFPSSKKPLPVR